MPLGFTVDGISGATIGSFSKLVHDETRRNWGQTQLAI